MKIRKYLNSINEMPRKRKHKLKNPEYDSKMVTKIVKLAGDLRDKNTSDKEDALDAAFKKLKVSQHSEEGLITREQFLN